MSESRLRETARPQFVAREVGPTTIGLLVVANAVLWIVARPAGQPTGTFVGQLLGAESILLLSRSTRSPTATTHSRPISSTRASKAV
jgi:hypothetical protein